MIASTPKRRDADIASLRRHGPTEMANPNGCRLRRSTFVRPTAGRKALPRPSLRPARWFRMRRSTAGFLALGSLTLATFPVSQWYLGHRLADYSCGGSRGLRPEARPRSLLIPVRGTVARLIRLGEKARQ